MAESYGFMVGKEYDDEFLADYIQALISDGIFDGNSLAVTAYDGMTIQVGLGRAWVQGRFYKLYGSPLQITLQPADNYTARTDYIVLHYDKIAGTIGIKVQDHYTRDDTAWDLFLAQIRIPPKTTTISQSMIEDWRLSELCGVVRCLVEHIDTSTLMTQLNDWADTYMTTTQEEFDTWFNSIKTTAETATNAANAAATNANNAANNANNKANAANTAATNANNSANTANTAATSADANAILANTAAAGADAAAARANTAAQEAEHLIDSGVDQVVTEKIDEQKGKANGLASLDADGKLVQMPTCTDINAVPTTRKVNGKYLSSDITINAADVKAECNNLLINSDFKVWQRGRSFTNPVNAYTADRWLCNGTGTVSYVDTDSSWMNIGMKITGTIQVKYILEDSEFQALRYKSVRLSICKKGSITVMNKTISSATVVDTSFSNTTVNWIKLELGSNGTQFTPRPYAVELAACQRYYKPIYQRVTSYTQYSEGSRYEIYLPTPMRTTPTVVGTVQIFNGENDGHHVTAGIGLENEMCSNSNIILHYGVPAGYYIVADIKADAEIYPEEDV